METDNFAILLCQTTALRAIEEHGEDIVLVDSEVNLLDPVIVQFHDIYK